MAAAPSTTRPYGHDPVLGQAPGVEGLKQVVAAGLDLPVAVDVGPDGALYVSLPALGADHGEGVIVRIDPLGANTGGATPTARSAPACTPVPETIAAP